MAWISLKWYYGVPYADLNSYLPSPEHIRAIPEEIGRKWSVALFDVSERKGCCVL
jgi:hypothetical protein